MTDFNLIINYSFLEDKLAFANTPLYLYQNYRRDDSILRLANRYSTNELQNFFDSLLAIDTKELEIFVFLYSVVIALSYKNPKEVELFFKKLPDINLKWGKEISDIYFSRIKSNNDSHFDLKYLPNIIQFSNIGSSTNNKTIVVGK